MGTCRELDVMVGAKLRGSAVPHEYANEAGNFS